MLRGFYKTVIVRSSKKDPRRNLMLRASYFILFSLISEFRPNKFSMSRSIVSFSRFFYKKIRELQSFIRAVKFKVFGIYNLYLLKRVSNEDFLDSFSSVRFFELASCSSFNDHLKSVFSKDTRNFKLFLTIQKSFGIKFVFSTNYKELRNLYLFQLYVRLYELEAVLQ